MRCAVIGAGAWGTALADLLAINGHDTMVWALEPDVAESINTSHENRRFLAGLSDLAIGCARRTRRRTAIRGASLVVFATPSQHLRRDRRASARRFSSATRFSSSRRRASSSDTLRLMTSVVAEVVPGHDVVGISGPSFAAEVVARQPTAIVAASTNQRAAHVDAARAEQHDLSRLHARRRDRRRAWRLAQERHGRRDRHRRRRWARPQLARGAHHARLARDDAARRRARRASVDVRRTRRRGRSRADVHRRVEPQSRDRYRDRKGRVARARAARERRPSPKAWSRRRARSRSRIGTASTCRSWRWSTAFCSRVTRLGAAVSELMTRELRSEQDP